MCIEASFMQPYSSCVYSCLPIEWYHAIPLIEGVCRMAVSQMRWDSWQDSSHTGIGAVCKLAQGLLKMVVYVFTFVSSVDAVSSQLAILKCAWSTLCAKRLHGCVYRKCVCVGGQREVGGGGRFSRTASFVFPWQASLCCTSLQLVCNGPLQL